MPWLNVGVTAVFGGVIVFGGVLVRGLITLCFWRCVSVSVFGIFMCWCCARLRCAYPLCLTAWSFLAVPGPTGSQERQALRDGRAAVQQRWFQPGRLLGGNEQGSSSHRQLLQVGTHLVFPVTPRSNPGVTRK